MILVLWSLAALTVGTLWALTLRRWRRLALAGGVVALAAGGVLCAVAAASELCAPAPAEVLLSWPLPLGEARLALDGLSAWFLLAVGVLATAAAPYSWSYFRADDGGATSTAFVCVMTGAMALLVCAADVVLFLVGWELVSLAAFVLVASRRNDPNAMRAGWMYLIATHLGTALFLLPLFGFLTAKAGGVDMAAIRDAVRDCGPGVHAVLFFLGLLGFGTKAGFMPMHVWLPVAHPAAPSPASALLSGVVIKAGIYGLLRLLGWLPSLPVGCAVAMLAFGAISGVGGVLYALAQHDLKRLLAYHSVENIGVIGVGVGAGMLGQAIGSPTLTALGYAGALLHVLNHALFKGLLFLSAGAVIHATGVANIERLGGLARRTPFNAAMFLIASLAICGLPPLNGFVSEWLIYGGLFGATYEASGVGAGAAAAGVVALALMGGLALACFAKAYSVVFLGQPRDASITAHATPWPMRLGMALLAAACVAIGLAPGVVTPLMAPGVAAISGAAPTAFAGATDAVLAPVAQLSLMAGVFAGVVVILTFVRRALLKRNMPAPIALVSTWGCGYSAPTARMQYTASSFAWTLVHSFRRVLWPDRVVTAPAGVFPGRSALETHTPDMAENDFFTPLFRAAARLCRMARTVTWSGKAPTPGDVAPSTERVNPLRLLLTRVAAGLRRGGVHVCLAFIVLALLVVVFVEAYASPAARRASSESSHVSAVEGVAP